MNEELPLNTSVRAKPGPKAGTRRASGAQHGGMTAHTDHSLGNLSREEEAHGEGRAPRRSMNGLDLKLYFAPKYMANKNMYYRIFIDRDSRIEKAKDAYYEHVFDENGAKLSAISGNTRMYLMALDKKYRAEDDKLKMERHNAMMRTEKSKKLSVEGIEDSDYEGSSSKESQDRFSS
jgi:hypothetical protein